MLPSCEVRERMLKMCGTSAFAAKGFRLFHSLCHPDNSACAPAVTARSLAGLTSIPMTEATERVRIRSTGRLFMTPPSTSIWPLRTTGGQTPGIELLARTDVHTGPSLCIATSALLRFDDVQKNGVHRSSM